MKQSFFNREKPLLTVMVQADNPERIKELMDKSAHDGAEAFGIQLEQLESRYKNKELYKDLFSYGGENPVYVTNYRYAQNNGKSDDLLADELLEAADCGADLCDVMGDLFDIQPDQITYDAAAVKKQKALIKKLHEKGAKVLISSHVFKFISAQKALEIAEAQQSRGADMCKIVVGADSMEQQLENLKIINMLKEKLNIPFLFLSVGECSVLRRISGAIGCCMYLCVYEHDRFSTPAQPLLKDIKILRDIIG